MSIVSREISYADTWYSYQCAFETFERAGYSRSDAIALMRKAVRLAAQARQKYQEDTGRMVRVALSLGPYGATLSPAQEFDGVYPPPYGPRGYHPDGPNINAFEDPNAEESSIESLANFHYNRLQTFLEPDEDGERVWSLFDGVAFETVPLARHQSSSRRRPQRMEWTPSFGPEP